MFFFLSLRQFEIIFKGDLKTVFHLTMHTFGNPINQWSHAFKPIPDFWETMLIKATSTLGTKTCHWSCRGGTFRKFPFNNLHIDCLIGLCAGPGILTFKVRWDFVEISEDPIVSFEWCHDDIEGLFEIMIYSLTNIANFVISTVPADGLAPLGVRPFADTMVTKFESCIYIWDQHLKRYEQAWPIQINFCVTQSSISCNSTHWDRETYMHQ